jgi:hypothetical protein
MYFNSMKLMSSYLKLLWGTQLRDEIRILQDDPNVKREVGRILKESFPLSTFYLVTNEWDHKLTRLFMIEELANRLSGICCEWKYLPHLKGQTLNILDLETRRSNQNLCKSSTMFIRIPDSFRRGSIALCQCKRGHCFKRSFYRPFLQDRPFT